MPDDSPKTRAPNVLISQFIVAALLVGGTAYWLFRARWPLGRVGEWVIRPNEGAWPVQALGIPFAVLMLFGAPAALAAYDRFRRAKSRSEQTASTTLCIAALTCFSFLWPWALIGPGGVSNLIAATWSDLSNGYFSTAYTVEDARSFTHDYPLRHQEHVSVSQAHVATHPPGAVLFYFGARRIFEASPPLQNGFTGLAENLVRSPVASIAEGAQATRRAAWVSANRPGGQYVALPVSAVGCALWCAFLILFASASIVPAVYLLASQGGAGQEHHEARGMIAAALFAAAPSLGLFAFTLDGLIAAGAAWTFVLASRRLAGGSHGWMMAAGGTLALTSFVSFGALSVGLLVVLALALHHGLTRGAVTDAALFAFAFLVGWIVLSLIFLMQPLIIFYKAMEAHHLATLSARDYWGWTWLNLFIFALFSGWPVALSVLTYLAAGWRFGSKHQVPVPAVALGIATLLSVLLLTFSGNVRGEVDRLWLFLLPPLCALAATWFQPSASSEGQASVTRTHNVALWIGLILLQAAQTLMMASTLAPLVLPL